MKKDFLDEVVAKRSKKSPGFKKQVAQARLNKAAIAWLESLDLENYLSPDDKMLRRAVRAFQKASGGK